MAMGLRVPIRGPSYSPWIVSRSTIRIAEVIIWLIGVVRICTTVDGGNLAPPRGPKVL